jgi:hypothetical protein
MKYPNTVKGRSANRENKYIIVFKGRSSINIFGSNKDKVFSVFLRALCGENALGFDLAFDSNKNKVFSAGTHHLGSPW